MASSGGYSISQGFFSALGITGGVISVSIALLAVYFCREFRVRASTEKVAEISLSEKLPVLSCSMVLEMKAGKGDMQCCAVCLVEFGDGQEQVRLLPKCGHCFHPSCIDAWIDSHLSCPICRTRLLDRQGSVKPAHLAIAMQD